MSAKVVQLLLTILSGLARNKAIHTVLIFQALTVHPRIIMARIMNETSRTYIFPHPILGSVMIIVEHELFTNFLRIKPQTFKGTDFEHAFVLILNWNVRLHKMGIVSRMELRDRCFSSSSVGLSDDYYRT